MHVYCVRLMTAAALANCFAKVCYNAGSKLIVTCVFTLIRPNLTTTSNFRVYAGIIIHII